MALFDKNTTEETTAPASSQASMKDLYSEGTKASKGKSGAQAKVASRRHSQAYRVLVKPIITEKGTGLATIAKYLFAVELGANKIEVAKAIEELYGVKPEKVNIIRMEGKTKVRGRVIGKRKDWKKAVITLPAGKTINVYEGV